MFRKMLGYFTLPLLLLLSNSSGNSAPQSPGKSPEGPTGTLEKMIVARGQRCDGSRFGTAQRNPLREARIETGHIAFRSGPQFFFHDPCL